MDKLAELSDEDVKSGLMDLDDMTKSEMSLDQLPELPMSSQFQRQKPRPPIKTIKANSKDKTAAKKLLNKDLRRDSDFKEKFERANREAAHLRAGGQSRISHLKESVKEKDSKCANSVTYLGNLWLSRVFIEHVGDPKNVGA